MNTLHFYSSSLHLDIYKFNFGLIASTRKVDTWFRCFQIGNRIFPEEFNWQQHYYLLVPMSRCLYHSCDVGVTLKNLVWLCITFRGKLDTDSRETCPLLMIDYSYCYIVVVAFYVFGVSCGGKHFHLPFPTKTLLGIKGVSRGFCRLS